MEEKVENTEHENRNKKEVNAEVKEESKLKIIEIKGGEKLKKRLERERKVRMRRRKRVNNEKQRKTRERKNVDGEEIIKDAERNEKHEDNKAWERKQKERRMEEARP